MDVINSFATVSLGEMAGVRLMNRIDSKYITSISTLWRLLDAMRDDYLLQEINGESLIPYSTRYFDTHDLRMYSEHQRGKKCRQKVRMRLYEHSAQPPFLEVKSKDNRGRTSKRRIAMDAGPDLGQYAEFLSAHSEFLPDSLIPQIENHFYRLTLVNRARTERITIDSNLEFRNLVNGCCRLLPALVIIEWKRDSRSDASCFGSLLRSFRIRESGFSKYCIGMAVTRPELRQNRLKARLRLLDKFDEVDEIG